MEALPAFDALENQKVGAAGGQLDVRRTDHRAAVQVRGDLYMLRFGHAGDLLRFEQSADTTEIHLQDGRGIGPQHPREIILRGQTLTCGDRNTRRARNERHLLR